MMGESIDLTKKQKCVILFVILLVFYLVALICVWSDNRKVPSLSEVKAYVESKYKQEFTVSPSYPTCGLGRGAYYDVTSLKYGFTFSVCVEQVVDLEPLFPYKQAYTYDDSDYTKHLKQYNTVLKLNSDIKANNADFFTLNKATDLDYKVDGAYTTLNFTVEQLSLSDESSIHIAYEVVNKVLSEAKDSKDVPKLASVNITILAPYKMTLPVLVDGYDFSNYADFRTQFRKSWQAVYG